MFAQKGVRVCVCVCVCVRAILELYGDRLGFIFTSSCCSRLGWGKVGMSNLMSMMGIRMSPWIAVALELGNPRVHGATHRSPDLM